MEVLDRSVANVRLVEFFCSRRRTRHAILRQNGSILSGPSVIWKHGRFSRLT